MERSAWYDTRFGLWSFWGAVVLTLVVVGLSTATGSIEVPRFVYVFGFLGAMVYVFTSFAKRFAADGRYVMKILSRTVAVLPLAAGVFLLSGAFLDVDAAALPGDPGTRLVAGLVFLAGIYVSITLQALGELAERLLGVSGGSDDADVRDVEDSDPEGSGAERGGTSVQ
jgi:hypothetical protein